MRSLVHTLLFVCILLTIFWALVGCAVTGWRTTMPYQVLGDHDAGAHIEEAAEAWNEACGEEMFRRQYVPALAFPVTVLQTPASGHCEGKGGEALQSLGWIVIFWDCIGGEQGVKTMMVHEFGHAAGLPHIDAGGVMEANPWPNHTSTPNQAELTELRRRGWKCPALGAKKN